MIPEYTPLIIALVLCWLFVVWITRCSHQWEIVTVDDKHRKVKRCVKCGKVMKL